MLALLTLVCVVTYSFEIVFGLAGTILMLMVMSFFLDAKTLVVYSLLPQILVGMIGLARSPKTVSIAYLARMLGFAALGGFAGLYLFQIFSERLFHYLLAAAISTSGIYLALSPARLRMRTPAAHALDTLAGASQALFGISAPLAMTRLLATFDDKTVVRNYALAFSLSMNLFRGVGYLGTGTIDSSVVHMMLASLPFLAVTLWFANQLHFRVNDRVFRRVVAWVILLGGATMFLNAP